jgi:hypothetical protein
MMYYNKKKKKHVDYGSRSFVASAIGVSVGSQIVGSVAAGTPVASTANSGLVAMSSMYGPMASVYGGGMALSHLQRLDYGQKKKKDKKWRY